MVVLVLLISRWKVAPCPAYLRGAFSFPSHRISLFISPLLQEEDGLPATYDHPPSDTDYDEAHLHRTPEEVADDLEHLSSDLFATDLFAQTMVLHPDIFYRDRTGSDSSDEEEENAFNHMQVRSPLLLLSCHPLTSALAA